MASRWCCLSQALLPCDDSPAEIAMDICVWTPTLRRAGRKHFEENTEVQRGTEGRRGSGEDNGAAPGAVGDAAAAGKGDSNITLKLWDFGGTDEFHAVHGLFFSG